MGVSVSAIGIADGAGFRARATQSARFDQGGIAGDLHAGAMRRACSRMRWHPRGVMVANTRQISILSVEELAAMAAILGIARVDPADLGGNLVLLGLDPLSATPPATRLQFPSGATLFVTEENLPCADPGRMMADMLGMPQLASRFAKAAIGRRGLVAIVERAGEVAVGDAVEVIAVKPRRLPAPAPSQAVAA